MDTQIAIFGGGLSGQAARRLAAQLGQTAVLFDERPGADRSTFAAEDVANFDQFVFSPGFAEGHPWRQLALASGKPVLSELAYAAAQWKGPRIGVTGTNGKTTATRLLTEALRASGRPALSCGNIGLPMSEALLQCADPESTVAVVEISSFQAELSAGLRLDGLLWTSFAEDHLDRYPTMEDYFAAKARLLDCLAADAPLVLGHGVAEAFERYGRLPEEALCAGSMTAFLSGLPAESPFARLPHRRNLEVVAAYWTAAGYPMADLIRVAAGFELSAHRCQRVRQRGDVHYWNDSKATNFEAALAAVEAMPGPVVWIGGGYPKGGDVEAFARAISPRVSGAVLYGTVANRLARAMTLGPGRVRECPSFAAAVREADALAGALGASHVLLSPGFASFDQFSSFEERGKSFVSTVLSL
jgi:UDP-N-acetylmuramoylalanine--D-glutamate ligase